MPDPKPSADQNAALDLANDPKKGSIRALRALNFFIADVQNGMGPYMAMYLQSSVHWGPAQIGSALAAGNIAQVLAQTPAGALIDRLRQKRALLLIGIGLIALAVLATAFFTVKPVVMSGQALIGVAGAIFPLCLSAIALGLVGRKRFDQAQGTNQAFNAAGNMFAALALGAVGYYFNLRWMFYFVGILCVGAVLCVLRIKGDDIDFDQARGADKGDACGDEPANKAAPAGAAAAPAGSVWDGIKELLECFRDLLRQKPVLVFLVSAVIFHFANAAMVPLVTQLLARGVGVKQAVLFTSGYMVASQLVFMVVAAVSGKLAGKVGRKPLFLFGFAALAARGVLYTLSHHPAALIAVQCMDGLGAGIFGVVGVLIIADLTKGTGRFNAAQGAIATAQGIGAFLSNSVAGYLAKNQGDNFTFLTLASIAAVGLVVFWVFMPETLEKSKEKMQPVAG
ncbi:MFS transporter [Hymenobacter cheonanensis]|uniref:MFS transporter n=1 Tax=Hymenobacter sp. CA2-7 TaxID=3063993 RepID=UPI0027138C0A|nr:MFS transporter [Hymenobacter sp. CA2-7]MDO7886412.1 MFS transporter [Hymenobacter sp. CA2-7]